MYSFYFKELMHTFPFFLKGLWVTVQITGMSIIGGLILGFIWGIIRTGKGKVLRHILGVWVDVIRGTPILVQIFIVFFIFPEFGIQLEAFPAAIITLTNMAACFICEIVASGIQAIPKGQQEAATAAGFSYYQRLRYIILPQSMRTILPPLVGQLVLIIKDSSIVSVIGVVDITRVGWFTVQRIPEGLMVFGLVGIMYFVICYPLIHLSANLEKKLTVDPNTL